MATVIGEVHTGQWNDWQQASRLNSSFGYGSPTNLGAVGIAGHTRGTLQPGAHMASDSGMIFWSPTYGSMNPIGSSVGRTHLGAIVIGESASGGWDSSQNAGMMDSSFAYGSETSLGAIGMAGVPAQGGHYSQRRTPHIPRRREPTQLWDLLTELVLDPIGKARRR